MTVAIAQPAEIIHLSGISWQTYETLLKELSDRRLRLTYNRGYLEIMAPSYEHENYKEVLGDFVKTIAQELKVKIAPCGSTTFKVTELSGAEPDACFYIKNISAIKGKKRIDLATDPPPDLVVEIDITSSSRNRFQVYADIEVPEIWLYNSKSFRIYILQNEEYATSSQSLAFPTLPLSEINRFLQQAETKDYLELVSEFRDWVKSQIQQ